MLPKTNRLNIASFNSNPQTAKKYPSVSFLLIIKISQKGLHIGVIVPKYLDKRSVYRNRTKRLIIEVIFQILPRMKPGLILIKAKKILKKEDRIIIEKEIENVFRKIGILTNN